MKVLIDADGCPVVEITVKLCRKYKVPCFIICDTAHIIQNENATTITVDKGPDSVDFTIANMAEKGDIVVTQDYGLASMCLGRQAKPLHQDGWLYTQWNITALMEQRHAAKKMRAGGIRTKGPKKRKIQQNIHYEENLENLLQNIFQG